MSEKRKYFRNWVEVQGIEQDALWYLSDQGDYVLVDDDQHVTADESFADDFYQVEDPSPPR